MTKTGKDAKLDMFVVVEETADLLDKNRRLYEEASHDIVTLFHEALKESEETSVIDFKHRVKSRNSLKEKIIRRELYKQSSNPAAILANISDVIGVMAECKFNDDEVKLYTRLREDFFLITEDELFYDPAIPNLFLYLGDPQPQVLKNGQEAYKIDGIYMKEGKKFRFELQIRSMVNAFWSEIEHELIYKNNI